MTTESWICVDCGVNTAPGVPTRIELEKALKTAEAFERLGGREASVPVKITNMCEIYMVRASVWEAAGVVPMGGCLCIGCLEKRLGRQLRPRDFPRRHPFNSTPGTPRLLRRRGG